MVRFFPSLKYGWGFTAPQNKRNMENQEEKETSLDYFFRITKNNAINLGRLIEGYIPAKKIYEMEIEEAKKEGWRKGYNDAVKFYNKFENK